MSLGLELGLGLAVLRGRVRVHVFHGEHCRRGSDPWRLGGLRGVAVAEAWRGWGVRGGLHSELGEVEFGAGLAPLVHDFGETVFGEEAVDDYDVDEDDDDFEDDFDDGADEAPVLVWFC